MSLKDDIWFSLKPRCPVCRRGRLFQPMSVTVVAECDACHEKLGQHDVGDGAAVFLIFLLGFTLVPMAWGAELLFAPPLWVHAVVWTIVALAIMAVVLPAIKAYIVMLDYRHRREGGQT